MKRMIEFKFHKSSYMLRPEEKNLLNRFSWQVTKFAGTSKSPEGAEDLMTFDDVPGSFL